jgi:hypothetical protein
MTMQHISQPPAIVRLSFDLFHWLGGGGVVVAFSSSFE